MTKQSRSAKRPKRATTAHFSVAPLRPKPLHPNALPANPSAPESTILVGQLLMAVPKRLLKRAVDRNIVRRAARQAWQERVLVNGPTKSALLRMTARPSVFETTSRPQRKRMWRAELQDLMDQYAAK